MVGFPGTTALDAERTTEFVLEHQDEIDTADVMGFRLERGLTVRGVVARPPLSDWRIALDYSPTDNNVMLQEEVAELEAACQERVWSCCPRLLHPLYRLVSPWSS